MYMNNDAFLSLTSILRVKNEIQIQGLHLTCFGLQILHAKVKQNPADPYFVLVCPPPFCFVLLWSYLSDKIRRPTPTGPSIDVRRQKAAT